MGTPAAAVVTGTQRIAAVVALVSGVATLLLAVTVAIVRFPSGLGVLACVVVAVVAAWFGVVRRGVLRIVGLAVAVLALLGVVALLFRNNGWPYLVGLVIGVVISCGFADRVPGTRGCLPPSRHTPGAVHQPVVRGGKAAKVGLTGEAAGRRIRSVELRRGDDLQQLVHDAVSGARTRWPRPGGTAPRRSWPPRPPSTTCPTPVSPRVPATTSPSIWGWTGTTLSAPSTPSSTAASTCRPGRGQRPGLRQQRLAWGSTPRRCRTRATATPRSAPCSTPSRRSGPVRNRADLQWVAPDGAVHGSAATILVSNNPYRLGRGRVGDPAAHRRGDARRGRRPGQGRRRGASRAGSGSGRPPSSRSTRPGPSRWESTARLSCSTPSDASGYVRARCAYASPPDTRVRHHRRCSPSLRRRRRRAARDRGRSAADERQAARRPPRESDTCRRQQDRAGEWAAPRIRPRSYSSRALPGSDGGARGAAGIASAPGRVLAHGAGQLER